MALPRLGGTGLDLVFLVGAGEGNRTLMTSLEGWGSAIELRPHARRPIRRVSTDSVPARRAPRRTTTAVTGVGEASRGVPPPRRRDADR
jgi:hypothetical protein